MGGLKDLAQAELDQRAQEAAERHSQNLERHQERRKESAKIIADYLSEWSGEEVTEEMLEPTDDPAINDKPITTPIGPPRWLVTIDGFELRVYSYGKAPEPELVEIEQSPEGTDLWRVIEKPHELLDPIIDPDAKPAMPAQSDE